MMKNNWIIGLPQALYENTPAFSMKIGGTVYDVTTHWNTEGSQTVLQQFKELLLSHRTLETDI